MTSVLATNRLKRTEKKKEKNSQRLQLVLTLLNLYLTSDVCNQGHESQLHVSVCLNISGIRVIDHM